MGYFLREHIFIGLGPTLAYEVPVFWADDLTDEEARTLAASVQNALKKLDENHGGGPWYFELAPSPQENPVAFVNWKDEWRDIKRILENPESIKPDSWESELAFLHKTAEDHANIIRDLREGHTPTIYLQCDGGSGFTTFACVDSLTRDEIETLESVAKSELYDMGLIFRIIDDWDAERNPSIYVQAKINWNWFEKRLETDENAADADETRMLARDVVYECIEEILALRNKPVIYGREDDEDEVDHHGIGEDDADNDDITEDVRHRGRPAAVLYLRAEEESGFTAGK